MRTAARPLDRAWAAVSCCRHCYFACSVVLLSCDCLCLLLLLLSAEKDPKAEEEAKKEEKEAAKVRLSNMLRMHPLAFRS
jgi:hypothetical protein